MMQPQQRYLLELYRAGMRAASDVARASIENAQRLHAQQVDALREALEANSQSAQRLSEATSITDLMALQVKLAGREAERAAQWWNRAWRTASETQVAMLGQVQSQVGELSERVRETYSAATRMAEGAMNDAADMAREAERKARKSA